MPDKPRAVQLVTADDDEKLDAEKHFQFGHESEIHCFFAAFKARMKVPSEHCDELGEKQTVCLLKT